MGHYITRYLLSILIEVLCKQSIIFIEQLLYGKYMEKDWFIPTFLF